jgi:carotenoid cleavage dioxygenase-like enzyme
VVTETKVTRRYLQGNYGPVEQEITAYDLPVTGNIPFELNGRYLRNGPNPIPVPEGLSHWFIGDGMLHGVELKEGKATWYRNRWVRTASLAERRGFVDPGGPPDVAFGGNPANTNIVSHAGKILALCEAGLPYQVTPDIDTIGRYDFAGRLKTRMTAHPKFDPKTGEMLFFGYSPLPPYLTYHVADADGKLVKSVEIDLPAPCMVHDFATTDRSVIFFDLPVIFDPSLIMSGTLPYRWKPENGARVGVMPRDGGNADVRWFDVEPCYVFHPMNAFQDNGNVVVDVVRYERMASASLEGPFDEPAPRLDRWTIDPVAGSVTEKILDDRPLEFPKVDDRVAGLRHRYGYGAQLDGAYTAVDFSSHLVKHDLEKQSSELHDFGRGAAVGEGVFIEARDDAAEDEGWVMIMVYDANRDASDLATLRADDFTGEPVAMVHLPARVPFGFHGNWVPD